MNTQELLADRDFWRDEAKRCYKQLEEYEALLDEIREFLEKKSMIEIRLDNELLLYQDDLREALLETIDELVNDESMTLAKTYKTYRHYSDEDLIEEIQDLTDKRLTIIFNFPLDYRVDVKQHILD